MGRWVLIRKLQNKIGNKHNAVFKHSYKWQEKYINRLPEPSGDIERSYLQYKCQMKLMGPISILLNILALPILLLEYLKVEKNSERVYLKKSEAVFYHIEKLQDVIPEELRKKYSSWKEIESPIIYYSRKEQKYFKKIVKKYPFSWLFLLKCLLKIKNYSAIIEQFSPDAIITCNEYSYTSSVLTDYCSCRKIKHINVMHGEKMYYMRDSFFRFHECYIWDEYYKKLFIKLRSDNEQFIISIPPSLIFSSKSVTKTHDYTYYLGDEDNKTLIAIAEKLRVLAKRNRVFVRPHPRYSNKRKVGEIFKDIDIEDCLIVSMEESILSTRYAISLFSTALIQAFYNGTGIVIDDLSNNARYEKLFEYGYMGIKKPHLLFSQIIDS